MTIKAAILDAQNKVINIILIESLSDVSGAIDAGNGAIGDTWNGSVFVKPDAETLTQKRARIWEDIKKYRDNLVENGGFQVGAHWYHSNLLSRTQYISLVMMGASIPANTIWKTLDNGYVAMTQTLAGQIFAAGAAQDSALFKKATEHKDAIDASNTPDSYDWKTGWPLTYTGE
jgi:hypothetical protein